MKKFAALLAAVMVMSLIASIMAITPAALNSSDWEVVHAPTGTPANAVVETTPNNGIRLSHEGHYPSSNAGLLYTQPLNIKEGISLNVTVETSAEGSSDAWYGICLMNRPVYFDVTNTDVDAGFGIVLLCRPGDTFQWFTVSDTGFALATTFTPSSDKYYYEEGVTIDFEIKFEDGALNIYVDGENVDYDFAEDLLPYLTDDQAFIGFSMSQTELEYQSFVINYLNGQQPASEGEAITKEQGGETTTDTGKIDFDSVDRFTLIDFTQPDSIKGITGNNCKVTYDEAESALKVEVTGPDPFFNIPMKKNMYFDGDKFCIIKMEYKTDFEGLSEFFYTTKEVPSMQYCNLQYDLEATNGEYKILEYDMQESENWTGEVRNFRIDPAAEGEEGQVFYYKSVSFEIWEEEETEAPPTDKVTETEATTTEATTTAPDATTTAADTKPAETKPVDNAQGGGVPVWVWIIIGVVAAAAIVAVIVIVTKKKK